MQFSACHLTLVLLCLSPAFVAGKRALLARIDDPAHFNETMTCSTAEMSSLSDTIEEAIKKARRLDGTRDLAPARCRGGCQQAPSFCHFVGIGCVATRRRLEHLTTNPTLRGLAEKTPKLEKDEIECNKEVAEIDTRLGELLPTLSSSCQEMMRRHSSFRCENVVTCTISHFALWDARSNTQLVPVVPAKDMNVCASIPFTFEAVVNFDNGPLQFWLTGHKKYNFTSNVITQEPYFMTDGSPTNSSLVGLTLIPGSYELLAWPENDATKQSLAKFKVKNC